MGLFGGKESKEEKQFWKAFKTAYSSHKEANLIELLEATKAYPAGWQGYFLAGLYYDLGIGNVAADTEKAAEYQMKAETSAKGTAGETWLNNFYDWYGKDAYNLYVRLDDMTLKCRKLGVAAMNTYNYKDEFLYPKKGDADFWCTFFMELPRKCIATKGAFFDLFLAWLSFSWDKDRIKYTGQLIDKANRCNELAAKRKLDHNDFTDMYIYILGHSALNDSPYMMDIAAEKSGESKVEFGIIRLMSAADIGCTPAIHELIRLAHASKGNYDSINRCCIKYYDGIDFEIKELEWSNDCLKVGDEEAFLLLEKYAK